MTLWLHIGAHKTGTTSLQDNLWRSRDTLRRHGLTYPANVTAVPSRSRQPFTHVFLVEALRQGVIGDCLDAIVAHHGAGDYFISCEDFCSLGAANRERLADALGARLGRIGVLLYLRDPASLIVSRVAHRLRTGRTLAQILAAPPHFPYRRTVEDWWATFGRANVTVRPYGVRETTADVLDVIGLPPEAVPRRNWRNATPSAEGIEAIGRARRSGESWAGKARLPGEDFTLPAHVVEAAVAAAADDLRWLENELGLVLPTEHVTERPARRS